MATNEKKEPEAGPKSFLTILPRIADGDAHDQISEELHALVKTIKKRASEQSKAVKGRLVITFSLTGDTDGTIDIRYDVKRTEPQPRRARTVFWVGADDNLTEKNPRQIELGLKDVSHKPQRRDPAANDAARDV